VALDGNVAGATAPTDEDLSAAPERNVFRVVATIAVMVVIAALLLNWMLYTRVPPAVSEDEALRFAERYDPASLPELDKPALDTLTPHVLSYETVARHAIPGHGSRAAEAIYATLNINLEVQVAMNTYVRSEGFESAVRAQQRVDEQMTPYSVEVETFMLNDTTPARSGYLEDRSAWAVGWVYENYAILAKTTFKNTPPAQKRQFLRNVGTPVVTETDKYQRTGKSGLDRARPQTAPEPTESKADE
jgi:hypothetical protein